MKVNSLADSSVSGIIFTGDTEVYGGDSGMLLQMEEDRLNFFL